MEYNSAPTGMRGVPCISARLNPGCVFDNELGVHAFRKVGRSLWLGENVQHARPTSS